VLVGPTACGKDIITRDVFAAVGRLIAAALQTLWTGWSLLVHGFLFLSLLRSWEAGSFPFLTVPKHFELPTLSTRWQHRAHSCQDLQQGTDIKTQVPKDALGLSLSFEKRQLRRLCMCILFQQWVQLPPFKRNGVVISATALFWGNARIRNSICKSWHLPFYTRQRSEEANAFLWRKSVSPSLGSLGLTGPHNILPNEVGR
jgi:hypothetical protein